ncbi:MAG: general secretion pathway protein GspB [Verrucomicrobia bacterium]|nr:general secretion pathway protein GspB [Verrucomicrobiota bacterium]
MKLLQNPIVVVVLVVVAIALVVSSFTPKSRPRRAAHPRATAAAKAEPDANTNAAAAATIKPERPIDLAYIEKRAQEWLEAPVRDPFFAYELLKQSNRQATNPAVSLVLTAIWRQSGGAFAVINGTVCAEGDKIEGLRVERIEDDRVILENEEWREVIRFPGATDGALRGQELPEQPEPVAGVGNN